MTATVWVGVAALGGAGAVARFLLDAAVMRRFDVELPLGTLAVNVLGSFVLGLLIGLDVSGDALLVVGTGLLGSFTTFSTLLFESHRLAEEGEARLGVVNVALSIAAGIGAAATGWAIGAAL
jgi:CrcB protein